MTDWMGFAEQLAEQLAVLPAGAIVKIVEAGLPPGHRGYGHSLRCGIEPLLVGRPALSKNGIDSLDIPGARPSWYSSPRQLQQNNILQRRIFNRHSRPNAISTINLYIWYSTPSDWVSRFQCKWNNAQLVPPLC
jgi:hypothetical protein